MIRAESCQFGKNLYMYPGERAADTLKQTELLYRSMTESRQKTSCEAVYPQTGKAGSKPPMR